jgi:hypothetical protein
VTNSTIGSTVTSDIMPTGTRGMPFNILIHMSGGCVISTKDIDLGISRGLMLWWVTCLAV